MDIISLIKDPNSYLGLLKYCIGPLAGAFSGSYIAYRLAIRREDKRTEKENILAAQQALFTLSLQINSIAIIKKQFLDKHINNRLRHYMLEPILTNDQTNLHININSISFILSTEYKNTLLELSVINDYFHTIMNGIKQRTTLHIEFQKLLSKADKNCSAGFNENEEEITKIVDRRICVSLKKITNDIYETSEEYIKKAISINDKLANELKTIFPKTKFIRFKLTP
jgi:hypothetical protein